VVRLGWCGILMQAEAALQPEIMKQVTSSWSIFFQPLTCLCQVL